MDPYSSKRETILLASLEIIQNHGLNELTTAKIARASDTAETIIYRHFSGKHAIMTELLQRVSADFQKSMATIGAESISPLEKLEKFTEFYLDFIQRTRGMSRILFSEQIHLANLSDPLKQAARNLAIEFRNFVRQILDEGVRGGYFTPKLDVEIASLSFMGLFYLLMHEWALDDFSWKVTDRKDPIIAHFSNIWASNQRQVIEKELQK